MKNILKEIGKSSLYALIAQFIAWSIFIFIDETWSNLTKTTLAYIMLAILSLIFVLYLIVMSHEKDLCIYNMKRFKATFLIVWSFLSVAVSRVVIDMVQAGTFHKCTYDCYIPIGAEFYIFGHFSLLFVFFILLFEGIGLFMKDLKIYPILFEKVKKEDYIQDSSDIDHMNVTDKEEDKKGNNLKNKIKKKKARNGTKL